MHYVIRLCYNYFMDNQSYLDQIAVKGRAKGPSEPLLSPLMIKIIIAGIIALITIVIVGSILNSANTTTITMYERLYSRINNLHGNGGPFKKYAKYIRSSTLRGYASDLETSLLNTGNQITTAVSKVGVDTKKISADVKKEESTRISNLLNKLENARLTGVIDPTYATSVSNEINQLMILERQVRAKTSDTGVAGIIDSSLRDLQTIYEKMHELSLTLN